VHGVVAGDAVSPTIVGPAAELMADRAIDLVALGQAALGVGRRRPKRLASRGEPCVAARSGRKGGDEVHLVTLAADDELELGNG